MAQALTGAALVTANTTASGTTSIFLPTDQVGRVHERPAEPMLYRSWEETGGRGPVSVIALKRRRRTLATDSRALTHTHLNLALAAHTCTIAYGTLGKFVG
jgi:hypothetical protein